MGNHFYKEETTKGRGKHLVVPITTFLYKHHIILLDIYFIRTVSNGAMESVESHHRRLYQTVTEAEGGGTERAGWIGVDLGTVTAIVALLLEIQFEQPHYFCAWNHGNYHEVRKTYRI